MTSLPVLGAVVGLRAEARIIERSAAGSGSKSRLLIECSGGKSERAEEAARRLIDRGATALLSFGIAGGLDPGLTAGTVVLGRTVVSADRTSRVADRAWLERLRTALTPVVPAVVGAVAAGDGIVASVSAKARWRSTSGALAVDLESGGVGRAAERTGTPFLVVRAIADAADMALPPAALVGLAADGRARPAAVLLSIARGPVQLPEMLRLAAAMRRALGALRGVLQRVGPDFALG